VITVLIPAHNEAAGISDTLESLKSQTQPPDRVVVVADNCTDATGEIALALGAEVIRTVGNTDKKAGALNFALEGLLPGANPEDMILVQDADSQLSHHRAGNRSPACRQAAWRRGWRLPRRRRRRIRGSPSA
jgi:glycosyltransferase involved in cell wall biosynthesis